MAQCVGPCCGGDHSPTTLVILCGSVLAALGISRLLLCSGRRLCNALHFRDLFCVKWAHYLSTHVDLLGAVQLSAFSLIRVLFKRIVGTVLVTIAISIHVCCWHAFARLFHADVAFTFYPVPRHMYCRYRVCHHLGLSLSVFLTCARGAVPYRCRLCTLSCRQKYTMCA